MLVDAVLVFRGREGRIIVLSSQVKISTEIAVIGERIKKN